MTSSGLGGLSFVSLGESHLCSVAELESEVSSEPWSLALFRGELEVSEASRNWLVAHQNGHLVGFGGMMFVDHEAHLMNIAIDPDRQGEGIATELLRRLVIEAIGRGVTDVTLEVRVGNEPAQSLYRRFGFGPVGVRPKYYADKSDALIMWAHDVAQAPYRELLNSLEKSL